MNYIIYQAYGKQEITEEAIFSMLSLLNIIPRLPEDLKLVVYTDNKAAFEKIPGLGDLIVFKEVNSVQIKAWRGEIDFVHRVKIEILKDFLSAHKGNILYTDSDTFFLQSPLSLFSLIGSGKLLMHTCEGRIDSGKNPIFKKVHRFISGNRFYVDGKKMKIPSSAYMWNAGVLGFSSDKKEILEKVLQLTDEMYRKYPKHVMEQFAFSWFFQEDQPIEATDHIIYHYWDFKEFREHISAFLRDNEEATLTEMAARTEHIAPYKLKPASKQKATFASRLVSIFVKKS